MSTLNLDQYPKVPDLLAGFYSPLAKTLHTIQKTKNRNLAYDGEGDFHEGVMFALITFCLICPFFFGSNLLFSFASVAFTMLVLKMCSNYFDICAWIFFSVYDDVTTKTKHIKDPFFIRTKNGKDENGQSVVSIEIAGKDAPIYSIWKVQIPKDDPEAIIDCVSRCEEIVDTANWKFEENKKASSKRKKRKLFSRS